MAACTSTGSRKQEILLMRFIVDRCEEINKGNLNSFSSEVLTEEKMEMLDRHILMSPPHHTYTIIHHPPSISTMPSIVPAYFLPLTSYFSPQHLSTSTPQHHTTPHHTPSPIHRAQISRKHTKTSTNTLHTNLQAYK